MHPFCSIEIRSNFRSDLCPNLGYQLISYTADCDTFDSCIPANI